MQPYEIIGAPLTVWLAATGTAFPNVDAAPSGSWTKLGTSGDKNYGEDGLTVAMDQAFGEFRAAGTTGKRKVWRTSEDLKISFMLADLSPEQFAKVLDDAAITTVAQSSGVAGNKRFSLNRGLSVSTFALLARGVSSVDEALNAQYEVPVVYQAAAPEVVYKKGEAAMLACEFDAIEDATSGFGVLRIQTTVAG